MQPIIIGVDFSNTSVHAVEYAISLANIMKSDVIMVWVDKITVPESAYAEPQPENKNEIKKHFDELMATLKPKLDKGLSLDYRLKKGKIYREINNLAQSTGASLIVAGTHGVSGYEEYWVGSNTIKLVTFTNIPVITVRHDFSIGNPIRKILLPIGHSNETIQKVPFTAYLAGIFQSEIRLLTYYNSSLKSVQRIADKHTQMAADYLRKKEIRFVQESLVSNELTKSLLKYTAGINADLVAIMTEQENPVNIHMGANAQQVISQSHIPVLSITPVEKFRLE